MTDTILYQRYDAEPVRMLIKDQRNALERAMVQVTPPNAFVELIRERLKKQLTLNPILPPAPSPQP